MAAASVAAILCGMTSLSTHAQAQSSTKRLVIGYSTYTVANPAFAGIIMGMKTESKKFGYRFIMANSNNSPSQQISDVESLMSEGANYIVITPYDGTAVAPAVAAATAHHVPVIALADHIVTPVTATYSMDHAEGGKLAAEQVVTFLTKKYGAPKGNVVDLEGIAGTVAAALREKGFADTLAKYPDIKIVARADGGFNTDQANQVMTAILQAHAKIDAVYGANDAETFGAIAAIKAAGRFAPVGQPGHIYAIGVDGSEPAIVGIRNGSQDATVSQEFIKMGIEMTDNIHAKEAGTISTIPSVVWPLMVIDTANIDSPEVKAYGIWADQVKQ
ncbi:sugar ABC transporter substrate-binding protein [Acidisoma cellulosilytica]|uniref:Sugar ABC transporter substrate-binding protein n=1 Tax=Acidisoma cellulosilyticum TaxID=2802395 RepID=A0A964E619_9PROT|nr:sugar ABC transporter substrate-binding protein [Acidisoma cellulosilyticum]MCB8882558.1 sugar ABC transporter substrate-binding protein [Acidisoma cellulosilyticum]